MKKIILFFTLVTTMMSSLVYANGNTDLQQSVDENLMSHTLEERQNQTEEEELIKDRKYIPATEERQEEEDSVEHYTPDLIDGEVIEDDGE